MMKRYSSLMQEYLSYFQYSKIIGTLSINMLCHVKIWYEIFENVFGWNFVWLNSTMNILLLAISKTNWKKTLSKRPQFLYYLIKQMFILWKYEQWKDKGWDWIHVDFAIVSNNAS